MVGDQQTEIEASNPALGTLKVRGTDIVSVLCMLFIAAIAFFLYQHITDTRTQSGQFVSALGELTASQREATKQQRLLTCIVSRPEVERKREFESNNSYCQQVTR